MIVGVRMPHGGAWVVYKGYFEVSHIYTADVSGRKVQRLLCQTGVTRWKEPQDEHRSSD